MLAVLKEILIRNKRKVILPLIKILEYIEKEKDEISVVSQRFQNFIISEHNLLFSMRASF